MKHLATTLLLLSALMCHAQKYDYRWVMGTYGTGYPDFDVIFTENSADTITTNRHLELENGQTTISDSTGNLLFYTNAAVIINAHDSIMQNGDSINYGYVWNLMGGTYDWLEDIIGLPTPNPDIWNLIHYYAEYNPSSEIFEFPWRIYQTQIDMSRNNGLGKVLFKNKTLVQDTLGTYVTACKHANGRDWWVLASKSPSNCFYEFLVQPDTIIQYPLQCLGWGNSDSDAVVGKFSPDGTKFAWVGGYGGVNVFDFDRCSGLLSNPLHFFFNGTPDSGIYQFCLSFSPNSRFLYVAQTRYILQFDLQAADIAGSVDTVGRYLPPPPHDSTTLSFPGTFFLMQLAPDGKIYLSATNGIRYLHVINEPDKKGDSCNFVNYGFVLPSYNSAGLPNYPNYRLGRLIGSECDTIYSDIRHQTPDERQLKIFPNPAKDYVIIDYGYTDWSKGGVSMEIMNELGQVVHSQQLPMYSGFQNIDVSNYAGGTYMVYIKRANEVIATNKFVKD